MPDNIAWIYVESPFKAEQLVVHVIDSVSTRYADRQQSLAPIAEIIAKQFHLVPGTYLAFFGSFEHMEQVAKLFQVHYPDVTVWTQTRRMDGSVNAYI